MEHFQYFKYQPVIDLMEEQKNIEDKGGTMRLGSYECEIKSLICSLNGSHRPHYIQVRRLADHFSKRVQDALKAKQKN